MFGRVEDYPLTASQRRMMKRAAEHSGGIFIAGQSELEAWDDIAARGLAEPVYRSKVGLSSFKLTFDGSIEARRR